MQVLRLLALFAALGLGSAEPAHAGSTRILKVLPHLLDEQGRHSPAPSLYERDAHQANLRRNPDLVFGLRFDIQYRATGYYFGPLQLRLEVRGSKDPKIARFEQTVRPRKLFSRWTRITLDRDAQLRLGDVVAWQATLWDGDRLVAEHRSFLW